MDYVLEGVLIALQFPIFVGFIYWVVRFQNSVSKGERMRLKFKNLSHVIKSFGFLLVCYFAFTAYLSLANLLSFTGTVTLPFADVNSLAISWMGAIGLFGLGYALSLTHPRVG